MKSVLMIACLFSAALMGHGENLLNNASFEKDRSGAPAGWSWHIER